MGELLRHRPVEGASVPARDHVAVQLHLEVDVEGPISPASEVRERDRLLLRRLDPALFEQRERCHPRRNRRLERLAEEGAERDVLPGLDVARAPVVDEDDAEDMLGETLHRHGLAAGTRHADDEAELELEVEPLRRRVHGHVRAWKHELPPRPPHLGPADDDGGRPAVIADG